MNDKGVRVTNEDKGQATLTSFMQKHKKVTYYKCATNVARRATMQASVPMGTMMMRHQLDQV
jgi:hypothetical protein